MNNESLKNSKVESSLDQRFAKRLRVYGRLHRLADMMDQAIAEGATADEAEARAIQELQKLGGDVLTDWAEAKADPEFVGSAGPTSRSHPPH